MGSTMTDHELCLLAAKAAGYLTETWVGNDAYIAGMMSRWNPLEDDADAFRLMADCKINVEFENHAVVATSYCDREAIATDCRELFGTDKHAATRRAIVRAAAAMGGKDEKAK